MNDVLPNASSTWLAVEHLCQSILSSRGYAQIRMPIVEYTQLFARSIGAETDIVSKEMYTFNDRNAESLTLRPEGTAGCVRAGIEHGLFYNQKQRLWYSGQMFRYERPQKGRYRQFYQIGAEAYGWDSPDIEAELLALIAEMFEKLGLENVHLQINSLGDASSRQAYRQALTDYLQAFFDDLDEDSQRRLENNPLRILDSKVERTQEILEDAPVITNFLNERSQARFQLLQEYLDGLGIEFKINPKLVRGLDYYNDTVFEWVNEGFGAQATVCAGGRYDGLVGQLGGQETPAFGFGMGIERLVLMLEEQQTEISKAKQAPDVFIISQGQRARAQALVIQQRLCDHELRVQLHCGEGSIKNQFKKADKSGAKVAVIIGEQEAESEEMAVKALIASQNGLEQCNFAQKDAYIAVTNYLESL